MPELPEVETVVQALKPHLVGRRITRVTVSGLRLRHDVLLHREPSVIGAVIRDVRRRAKYLLMKVEQDRAIMFHLGMSGSFRVELETNDLRKHDHVVLHLDDGNTARFNDPRRFGMAKLIRLSEEGEPLGLGELGPEPLSDAFSVDSLARCCRGKARPIKNLIMDSAVVVGVGNIYASESLFRAGIRPTMAAGAVSRVRLQRLVEAVREVLTDAIEDGGSTIRDFGGVNGREGKFQQRLAVYGKDGDRCNQCRRGVVRKIVQAGRSTFFCPVCQR